MASDLNSVVLIGRLTKDVDLRHTNTGTSVATFSIANNKTYTMGGEKKEQVSFFNCVAWGKLGELMAQYCRKGHRVGLEGRLQQRTWEKDGEKRSTVEIVVENLQFLQPKDGAEHPDVPAATPAEPAPFNDNDIPF